MTPPPRVAIGVVAAALVILGIVVAAGAFDDSLTRRGFVLEGDKICGDTVVRATVELDRGREVVPQLEAIRLLSDGYSRATARLERLDVEDQDEAMRDRMVSEFERVASQLMAAATTSNDPVEGRARAIVVYESLRPLAQELRDYGFAVCGGRAPT